MWNFTIQHLCLTSHRSIDQKIPSASAGNASTVLFWWRTLLILLKFECVKRSLTYLKSRQFSISKVLPKFWDFWRPTFLNLLQSVWHLFLSIDKCFWVKKMSNQTIPNNLLMLSNPKRAKIGPKMPFLPI